MVRRISVCDRRENHRWPSLGRTWTQWSTLIACLCSLVAPVVLGVVLMFIVLKFLIFFKQKTNLMNVFMSAREEWQSTRHWRLIKPLNKTIDNTIKLKVFKFIPQFDWNDLLHQCKRIRLLRNHVRNQTNTTIRCKQMIRRQWCRHVDANIRRVMSSVLCRHQDEQKKSAMLNIIYLNLFWIEKFQKYVYKNSDICFDLPKCCIIVAWILSFVLTNNSKSLRVKYFPLEGSFSIASKASIKESSFDKAPEFKSKIVGPPVPPPTKKKTLFKISFFFWKKEQF